jgi:hypothetical protein
MEMTMQLHPRDVGGNALDAHDVFAAARWFDSLWNSTAKAVSFDTIEWQCSPWGSGRGRAYWTDTAIFDVTAAVFGLETSRNFDARDELIVSVPLDRLKEVVALVDRLEEEAPDDWLWLSQNDRDEQIASAAQMLGLALDAVAENERLLEVLRIH